MFRAFSFGILPLIYLGVVALTLYDIFYTGKYASKKSRLTWCLLIIVLPFIPLGFIVWIIYPFTGHKSLLRESLLKLEGENTPAKPVVGPNSTVSVISSTELLKQDQTFEYNSLAQATPQTVSNYNLGDIEKFKKTTTVIGTVLSVVMILAGITVVGFMILFAIVLYQCSRPGAKCM